MKSSLFIGAGLALTAVVAYAAKDPVVMTVNGRDVHRSEFEYLYHKNTQQQIEPQPLDQYVEMFKVYKLKVADALANGVDTTKTFKRDMNQYRSELAGPLLVDSVLLYKLAHEQYDRGAIEREAHHIMLFKTPDKAKNRELRQRMDSLHTVLANGGDFEELAREFSQDQGSKANGGNMGFVMAGMLPVEFEEVMYSLPEGQVSDVTETQMGYHILKGGASRPFSGFCEASHILFSTQGKDEARVYALADSVANVLRQDPSQFTALAKKYSNDPSVAQNGGALPPFSAGKMVKEFSDAAFALADGEISDPVKTRFGYHVIYKRGHQGMQPFDNAKAGLFARITNPGDARNEVLLDNNWEKWGKRFKLKNNAKLVAELRQNIASEGVEKALADAMAAGRGAETLFKIGKDIYTLGDFNNYAATLAKRNNDPDEARFFDKALRRFQTNMLREDAYDAVIGENPEIGNLLNEYRDGSLLYEISLRNVWDKAAKDTEGLNRYFAEHRGDFSWSEPRVKGFLVKAESDSLANAVRLRMQQLGTDTLVKTIRSEFGMPVSIDRILVKKGDNQIVDYLVFNESQGDAPFVQGYPAYFVYDIRTLKEPEELNDVKGLVTSAYQDQLEQDWIRDLKQRYPIVVNEKELKKIK